MGESIDETIARLEDLMARATKRPWRVFYSNRILAIMKGDRPPTKANGYPTRNWPEIIKWAGFDCTDVGARYDRANAELLTEAVNALPLLIAAAKASRP